MERAYHNLILHSGITVGGCWLDSATVGRHGRIGSVGTAYPVVRHLLIEFFRRLGLTTRVLAATATAATDATATATSLLAGILSGSCRLGLGLLALGLTNTVAERLRWRRGGSALSIKDNLNLGFSSAIV